MNWDDPRSGGPAFPFTGGVAGSLTHVGMQLRDYFAAKVMEGIVAGCSITANPKKIERVLYQDIAEVSYALADAMLEVRKR